MSSVSKGIRKVQVMLRWDPSPIGAPAHDLDIIAATYLADNPQGPAAYLVHFDSRSPDGTIILNRDSRTGQGFGFDEVMTLELDRLSAAYSRVVVGVAIQQAGEEMTFGDIPNSGVRLVEGHTTLFEDDFTDVHGSTAATVAEFTRESGTWGLVADVRGFGGDPDAFAATMGRIDS
ncbi:TerD family protein [Streptomyces sp. NPDC051219]|uniref:TerD family protein n=1 Tax=Streptomyces sp. NPDC051219 TaxID=3155283 RepID=UPI00342912A7